MTTRARFLGTLGAGTAAGAFPTAIFAQARKPLSIGYVPSTLFAPVFVAQIPPFYRDEDRREERRRDVADRERLARLREDRGRKRTGSGTGAERAGETSAGRHVDAASRLGDRHSAAEDADLLDLDFHHVAVFEELGRRACEADAFRRSGRDDVAWFERRALGELGDAARDREDHHAGVRVLLRHAVHAQRDVDLLRIADLVGADDPRAERTGVVERLALEPLRRRALQVARADVVERGIPEDHAERIRFRYVLTANADHDREFRLPVVRLRNGAAEMQRCIRIGDRGRCFREDGRRRGELQLLAAHARAFLGVREVVPSDAEDVLVRVQRRMERRAAESDRFAEARERGGARGRLERDQFLDGRDGAAAPAAEGDAARVALRHDAPAARTFRQTGRDAGRRAARLHADQPGTEAAADDGHALRRPATDLAG